MFEQGLNHRTYVIRKLIKQSACEKLEAKAKLVSKFEMLGDS